MSAQPEIFVRTDIRHPRLRYVLRVVGEDLGYRFRFYNEHNVFAHAEPPYLISYGGKAPRSLPAHPLLQGKPYSPADPASDFNIAPGGMPTMCQTPQGPDLLAAIFFCLSRYEEYQPFTPDAHGRFTASLSHAARFGYLHRPVVREWTAALGATLRAWFPDLPPPARSPFAFQPSYDIDILYAFSHRGWRGHASGVKDLLTGRFRRAAHRWFPGPRDPYDTLSELQHLHGEYGLRPWYFWLLSSRQHPHDPNPYPIPESQRAWMRHLDGEAECGIHPSYLSSERPELFATEKERLETILNRPVARSRQHFLRFRLPDTYRALIDAGIRSEASMGYGDAVGWRAGTNRPFRWYDLDRENETKLVVHPFAAMDVTLRNYLGLDAAAARRAVVELADATVPVGGPFVLLWHNSSFAGDYGWSGWWEMYRSLVGELVGKGVVTNRP